nr:MAG TPA: hypothetical protein [Caudoviricetes sp.]
MRWMRKNNFVCSHEALKHCKRTMEKCSPDCKEYGNCGECGNYQIPYSQEPCSSCNFLCVDKPKEHREGDKE